MHALYESSCGPAVQRSRQRLFRLAKKGQLPTCLAADLATEFSPEGQEPYSPVMHGVNMLEGIQHRPVPLWERLQGCCLLL